jgi:hypothetical protein
MAFVLPSRFSEDDFLPHAEAMAKFKAERIEPQLDQYRLSDHKEFKDFERRKGAMVHSSRFLHRLRQIEPRLVVQQQIMFPDDWGLYLQRGSKLIFLSQVTKGWLTEFSYTLVDEKDLPSDPKWGWRTVLLRLMSKGVFTWEQVLKEFGNSQGANSDRWHQYTEPYRNRHSSGVVHLTLKGHFEN